jgi:hypothetical protein
VADQTIERMVVDGSPARCFEVVADIEQERTSVVSFRAGAFGRSTSYTLVYDYSRAPTELRWVQQQGDLTSRLDGIYRFQPAPEGGTEVTYELAIDLRVPLPGFIKRRAEGNIIHAAIRDLKARVESTR